MINIAIAKGSLLKDGLDKLKRAGITFDIDASSRKLFFIDQTNTYKLLQIRPWDIPAYVEQGAADLGIVGLDVLEEHRSQAIRLKDLEFGGCKLVVAAPDTHTKVLSHHMTIATKYPNCTTSYIQSKGLKINLVKLYGAIELAPLTGLSHMICDLTATGATLKENGLSIVDTLFESSAHLIANPISLKCHYAEIQQLLHNLG